ncbi:MAG: T9SS type A sorting domain-containing protein [bacterium]
MKKAGLLLLVPFIAGAAVWYFIAHKPGSTPVSSVKKEISRERKKLPGAMLLPLQVEHQFNMLRDPKTGTIPSDIRSRELAFASDLPVKKLMAGQTWDWRGPANIGGRMLCIAIDIDNEDHILAGSASGGMWESNNGGGLWHKVTAPDDEQSATCIVQDRRPGKHNIWYYGTGELLSTTNRNVSTSVRTVGIGNGIFKSTDNGATWQPLASTQGGELGVLKDVFQGTWRILTDPVTTDKDIVYAACYGAIMRSEDGGENWQVVLGDLVNKSYCTDLAVTSDGILYAALSGYGWSIEPPGKKGIWRSANGTSWEEITPKGFPTDNRVTRLAVAPSNENVVYVFTESQSPDLNPFNGYTNSVNTFWKMTWSPLADSAVWQNRTMGIPGHGDGSINTWPFSLVVYGGYCFTMGVKPDDEDVVFLGGMCLYRSDNGFADSLQTAFLGGSPYDMDSLHQIHPDQHGIVFLPSDSKTMFMANDGGVYRTKDCMADSAHIYWDRQNGKLTTTQFYSVAIDHSSQGEDWILGGLQDNNWYYTVTDNPGEFWFNIDICYDGFATAVASAWEFCVISAYSGNIWTSQFDQDMHTKNIYSQLPDTLLKYYDPVMGSNALFPFYQNFALDQKNNETFYLPTVASIWRKDNMKAAAFDTGLRNAGWNHLSNVDVGNASQISAISVSVNPANRLYYGTSLGKVYRLDNANTGNPVPVDITGSNFPANAFVACIDANPLNADNIMVVFSNYGVQSLFHSNDGGSTWTAVGGNLEEHLDGSGSGPSVRWSEVLTYKGEKVIFIGTSVGLFSTTELKGDSTVWMQEGPSTIGNVLVDMIDTRQTDGFIAVATHGNGVYSTYYKSTAGIGEQEYTNLQVGSPYPVPARNLVSLPLDLADAGSIEISLMNNAGHELGTIFREKCGAGKQVIPLNVKGVPAGVYYLRIKSEAAEITRKIVVI